MTAALKYKKYRLSTQHQKSFPSNILKTLEITPNKKKACILTKTMLFSHEKNCSSIQIRNKKFDTPWLTKQPRLSPQQHVV